MTPARRGAAAFAPTPAPDLDRAHDPGADGAARRAGALPDDVAAEPIPSPSGGHIRVGTASWTDPTMTARGVFYPDSADTAEERLAYYASQFPIVEVDATYYALPARRTAELWVERTPPDFIFDIKAHALMTGQPTEVKRLPKDLREALPAELAAKSRIYAKDLPDEIRDEVWAPLRGRARAAGRGRSAGLDPAPVPALVLHQLGEPRHDRGRRPAGCAPLALSARSSSGVPAGSTRRTSSGRCASSATGPSRSWWWTGRRASSRACRRSSRRPSPGSRDRALPRPSQCDLGGDRRPDRRALPLPLRRDELADWAPRVREIAAQAKDTHVLFNNCYANYGSTNALELARLLEDLQGTDPVASDPG